MPLCICRWFLELPSPERNIPQLDYLSNTSNSNGKTSSFSVFLSSPKHAILIDVLDGSCVYSTDASQDCQLCTVLVSVGKKTWPDPRLTKIYGIDPKLPAVND